jgi:hypothetical protein
MQKDKIEDSIESFYLYQHFKGIEKDKKFGTLMDDMSKARMISMIK